MTNAGPEAKDLQSAFERGAESGRSAGSCPPLDRLWEAQSGDLEPGEVRELIDHTSHCPACAEAWRVAHRLGAMDSAATRRRAQVVRWRGLAAAAASILMAVVAVWALWLTRGPEPVPAYRTGPETPILSLVSEERPLPRSAFVLRWSPGPDGTLYTVRVTTERFAPIWVADGLDRSECTVPEGRLAGLEAGTRVLWQVASIAPDGRQTASQTFFAVLE